MKKMLWILALLLIAGSAFAEFSKVGSSGAQFLKIGVGARYQAMADASVATVGDVYAAYWNPAGLSSVENTSVSFTNVNWLLDIDLNYAAIAHYFEEVGTFALSASVLSMDDQEITTLDNFSNEYTATGDYFSATSYAVGLSYARMLTNRFSFGATVKYVGERIHNSSAGGVAVDFGTQLHTGFKSLRLGMSISNLGPELSFSGSDLDFRGTDGNGSSLKTTGYDMPMVFRFGLAYDVNMGPNSVLMLSSELRHPNDNEQQGAMGAEFGFREQYFLRGGYKFNYDEEGLTLGGGIQTALASETRLIIDYAWQDFGRLENTHRFSVGFTF